MWQFMVRSMRVDAENRCGYLMEIQCGRISEAYQQQLEIPQVPFDQPELVPSL